MTGKPWSSILRDRIFVPLGMKNTGFDDPAQVLPQRASGYVRTYDGLVNARFSDRSNAYAAGGLYSTVEDLYRWDRGLYASDVLSEKWRAEMFRVRQANYACGWKVAHPRIRGLSRRPLRVWHGGGAPGFEALLTRFPEDGFFVVLLSNVANGTDLGSMTDAVAALLYGVQPEAPKPSMAEMVYRGWKQSGIESAIAVYYRQRKDYDVAESELNSLGYHFLHELKRPQDAVSLFRLNTESFPESANAQDSLAEGCLAVGDIECARVCFRRILDLDPNNDRARRKLAGLQ